MELQIQDLVDSIKRDGIAEAEKKAQQIISEAREKAQEIVRGGQKEAEKIVEDARKEVAVMKSSGRAALEQAGRDVILSLKRTIKEHFDRLLVQEVSSALSSKDLISLIIQVVQSDTSAASSEIQLQKKSLESLGETLRSTLAKEIKEGLVITPVSSVQTGFRYAAKDGSSYLDFSDEEIASLLSPFLNVSIQEILYQTSDKQK